MLHCKGSIDNSSWSLRQELSIISFSYLFLTLRTCMLIVINKKAWCNWQRPIGTLAKTGMCQLVLPKTCLQHNWCEVCPEKEPKMNQENAIGKDLQLWAVIGKVLSSNPTWSHMQGEIHSTSSVKWKLWYSKHEARGILVNVLKLLAEAVPKLSVTLKITAENWKKKPKKTPKQLF